MIANNDCGDVIVVTPTFNNNANENMDVKNFKYELRNDIVPMIEAKYSTYAANDVSEASLISSRNHRAFAGFSRGSLTAFSAVWDGCFDYFAYIGNFSGLDPNEEGFVESILEKMSEDGIYANYEMKYWYNGNGTKDMAEEDHLTHYNQMLELGDDLWQEGENFEEGDNCIMVDKPGKDHNYISWMVDLYNILSVFFKVP